MPKLRSVAAALLAAAVVGAPARAAPVVADAPVAIEALTWTELRDRIAAGATTVLVPIGGTEQNGPHMVLGKHNVRVRMLAERIARAHGTALVAPVLAYVPQGAIEPPQAHMRWPGTITVDEATFEALLTSAARSLRAAGFRTVVFVGDHGGYRRNLERVATKLDREWITRVPAARALALDAYYRAASDGFAQLLAARGFAATEIGDHAGLADTALALAVDRTLVREGALRAAPARGSGVEGDPRRATAALGQLGIERIVEASLAALRAAAPASQPSQETPR